MQINSGNTLTSLQLVLMLLFSLFTGMVEQAKAQVKNGFDLSNSSIPSEKIKAGGPPRDGIPSLDDPSFVAAGEADYLNPEDRVLGVSIQGETKAYPIRILNWHEIVNDEFSDKPVLITYCPLCGSGMAFDSKVKGKSLEFGVSGLLYNSDVLMYDRQTESLWSQLMAKAISGPMKGTRLKQIPLTHTSWSNWKKNHPDTRVLSKNMGYDRDYSRNPYAGYAKDEKIFFPVENKNDAYHPKEPVLAVIQKDFKKAYPFEELKKSETPFTDRLGGKEVKVYFDEKNSTGKIKTAEGDTIPTVTLYWFAWTAFYPDAPVYKAE